MSKPRVLFLFSDTGGGHRSAAEAVREALLTQGQGRFEVEMVDFLRSYAPPPFDRFPELYPSMIRRPEGWDLFYRLSNGPRQVRSIGRLTWPYVRRAARQIIQAHPADLIVSFHPLAIDSALRARRAFTKDKQVPFITVVTDLVSTHAFWFHKNSDLVIVPTRPAFDQAIRFGIQPEKLVEVGLPVAERFCRPAGNRDDLRAALGWPQDRKMVLLMGGGDGVGPLEETAKAIANAGLDTGLAIVTGRNAALKVRMENQSWEVYTKVYGFVREMPDMMQAADVLVTKAGPGTISEALNAGLPMILYNYLPGQEEGNVPYLTETGAGMWAPKPVDVVEGLRRWEEVPEAYQAARTAAMKLARPGAAADIAGLIIARL